MHILGSRNAGLPTDSGSFGKKALKTTNLKGINGMKIKN